MNAIEVDNLEKHYREVHALRGITLAVNAGTVLGLLGRNGSGKTTTVRILATLTLPTAGTATVDRFDVATHPHEVRRRIGVTMQAAALDPEMTAREHLELVCGAWNPKRSTARDQAASLLADFGLTDAADRVIATYSGGMRRRLDIAGALANQPMVLFLDEPTTGLDAQSRRALWQRVRDLRDAGTTVLLTTQYLEEADTLADHLAILDRGHIVADGTPADIKQRHSRTVVRARFDTTASPGRFNGTAPDADGWVQAEVDTPTDALALLDEARRAGIALAEVAIAPPTLEDAFLTVTGTAIEPTELPAPAPILTGAP